MKSPEEIAREAEEARAAATAELSETVNAVLQSVPGRKLFKHLHNICGFNMTSLVVNPRTGEVLSESTIYNESRRKVYLQLRVAADPRLLLPVEMAVEEEQRKTAKAIVKKPRTKTRKK